MDIEVTSGEGAGHGLSRRNTIRLLVGAAVLPAVVVGRPLAAGAAPQPAAALPDALRRLDKPDLALREITTVTSQTHRLTFSEATWTGGHTYVRHLSVATPDGWVSVTDPDRAFDEQWVVLTSAKEPSPDDYYRSADPHWVAFDSIEQLDAKTVELRGHRDGVFDLRVRWSLERAQPEVQYRLTAHADGHYLVGYQATDIAAEDEVTEVLCGARQHARVIGPPVSLGAWELFAPMSLIERPASGTTVTTGIYLPGDVLEFEHERDLGNRGQPFGMSLRSDSGEVQPTVYAPQAGTRSLLAAGDSVAYAFGVAAYASSLYEAYVDLCRTEYGLTAYRENIYDTSLTQTVFNIRDLVAIEPDGDDSTTFVPSLSGWWSRAKGFVDVENDQAVRTSVAGVLLAAGYLTSTPDEAGAFYTSRSRPLIEYHVSRRNHGTTPIIGKDVYGDATIRSYGLGGVAVDAATLVPLYRQTRGTSAGLHDRAMSVIRQPIAREFRTPMSTAMQAYILTGDDGYLAEAIALARRYARTQIFTPYTSNQPEGGFAYGNAKMWTELFVLFELTGEREFLDAAYHEVKRFITQVEVRPVPHGTVEVPSTRVIDDQFDDWSPSVLPDYPNDEIEPTEVPAWLVSTTGLTFEQLTTFKSKGDDPNPGGGFVLNPIWAPFLLRLAWHVEDEFLADMAHNLVVGRFTNYPGYYNRQFISQPMEPDFPLVGPPGLSCIYYHHAPGQLGLAIDYLFSEHFTRSGGEISFPHEFEADFVYFKYSTYGHRPGVFYGEDGVWPYLPTGAVTIDEPQVNWLAGVGNDSFYLSLTNEDTRPRPVWVGFDPDLTGVVRSRTYEAETLDIAGRRRGSVRGGRIHVVVPARGIATVVVRGAGRPAPWHWLPSVTDRGSASHAVEDATPGTPGGLTRALTMLRPDRSAADVYIQSDAVEPATLIYRINDGPEQVIADKPYPNEWTITLPAVNDRLSLRVETSRRTSATLEVQLPPSVTTIAPEGQAFIGSLQIQATASPGDNLELAVHLISAVPEPVADVAIDLALPDGWHAAPHGGHPSVLDPGVTTIYRYTLDIPADASVGVGRVTALARWDGDEIALEPTTVEVLEPVRVTSLTADPNPVHRPGGSTELTVAVLNRGSVPVRRTVTLRHQARWTLSETTLELELPARAEVEHTVTATSTTAVDPAAVHFFSAGIEDGPRAQVSVRVADPDTIIITNNDYYPRYLQTGEWLVSGLPGADGGSSRYSPLDVTGGTATWTPNLAEAGSYEVAVWYPSNAETSTAAVYTVRHAGGETEFVVNQQENPRTWNPLGTFDFPAGEGGHVRLEVREANGYTRVSGARFRRVT